MSFFLLTIALLIAALLLKVLVDIPLDLLGLIHISGWVRLLLIVSLFSWVIGE